MEEVKKDKNLENKGCVDPNIDSTTDNECNGNLIVDARGCPVENPCGCSVSCCCC